MDPWDLLPCLGRLLTMSAVPTGSTPSEREIQIAIAPLETLLNEDLGEAAASVDPPLITIEEIGSKVRKVTVRLLILLTDLAIQGGDALRVMKIPLVCAVAEFQCLTQLS